MQVIKFCNQDTYFEISNSLKAASNHLVTPEQFVRNGEKYLEQGTKLGVRNLFLERALCSL
jgi:hypothetical protein